MSRDVKIGIVVAVLDELATVGYVTGDHHKRQSLELIRGIVKDYFLSGIPAKADNTIWGITLIANVQPINQVCLNRQLARLATLSEKALSELLNQYANTI